MSAAGEGGQSQQNKRRFAEITNHNLQVIVDAKDAKNTRRSTDQATRLFRNYLGEKQMDPAFENYDKETLNKTLSKFYAEARTTDGELYKKSSLMTIRHALNRFLGSFSEIDIRKDPVFKDSEKVFAAVCADLKRQGRGGVQHHPPIDSSDLVRMYEQFNLNDPVQLQWRVFCDLMLYCGRRGRENLRDLKITDFSCTSDGDGHLYIYLDKDERTKNHQTDANTAAGRMYALPNDDALCPVKTFVNYKKKLNPKCVFLFQRPSKSPKDKIWYDNMPLGVNTLGKIMTDISKQFSLSRNYTNHSLRATTVHILYAANIPGRHIMSITGHKSETSLKTYTGFTTSKTKKTMSTIVSESLRSTSETNTKHENNNSEKEKLTVLNFALTMDDIDLAPSSLTNSQVDFLESIVSDRDNDTAFDNVLATFDITHVPVVQVPVTNNIVQNASSSTNAISNVSIPNQLPAYNQQSMSMNSFNMMSIPAPIIHNYGHITINYK